MTRQVALKPAMQHSQRVHIVIATALTSGIVTLSVSLAMGWLTLGRHAVSRQEVVEMIETRTPYAAEREALRTAVQQNSARLDELTQITRELERQGNRAEAKLDLLLQHFVRDSKPKD